MSASRYRNMPGCGARAGLPLSLLLGLAACQPAGGGGDGAVPGDRSDTQPFAEIAEDEAVRFTGTEPFWGGEVLDREMTYRTLDKPDGQSIRVSRFAGRGGLSFSGTLEGKALTLAITPGACSDGMSDRAYPFVATLRVGETTSREGCAWTSKHPFTGPQAP